MDQTVNRRWCLARRPVGLVKPSDFEWREDPPPTPGEGEVLVRNIYLSLDPTNRGWMNAGPGYLPGIKIGDTLRGISLGVVVESHSPGVQPGDLVQGILGWQDYAAAKADHLTVLPRIPGLPMTAHFGLFGHIGLTAYFGLLEIGQPKAGETLVVSAAAGAVGSLVGQIGKLQGCRVVGIAGSDAKCAWITEALGMDAAINYKTEDVPQALKKHCSQGIDVYFDNVGGEILDAALAHINLHARIVLCGLISMYNATQPVPGPYNFPNILTRRARVEGFITIDYQSRALEAISALAGWYTQGKLQYRVDVVEGLENAPTALNKLFDGTNQGKLIVKIAPEPEEE
jgi:NADPH-dependent curcumin reductase CurA